MTSDNDAFDQFCAACRRGDNEAAQQLFASIDNVNAFDAKFRNTPLMLGARSKNADLVRFLLDNGADVTCCDALKRTALHKAADVRTTSTFFVC
mgnify:CR=1 FL=1